MQDDALDYITELNVAVKEVKDEDWLRDRCGMFTSSPISKLMQKGRGSDWGQAAETMIAEKLAERLTGVPIASGGSAATEWGNDYESEAIGHYIRQTGIQVEYHGQMFVKFSEIAGGSPDGFIGDDGLIEVKCPYNSGNHIKTMLFDEIKKEYAFQIQSLMLFTGRQWCDFVSYDPRQVDALKMRIIRVKRDEDICTQIADRIEAANQRLLELVEQLPTKVKELLDDNGFKKQTPEIHIS